MSVFPRLPPPRASIALALLLGVACSKESTPGAAAHAKPAPSASAASAAPVASVPLPPPTESASPTETPSDGAREAHEGDPLRLPSGAPAATAQRILHVGDSMVPLVGNYLRPLVQADGRKFWIDSVTSSSTLEWGGAKRLLQAAMYRYDPDLVLISLGSNELFDPTPERRAAAVRQVVADTRGRPCLWIEPPAWKKDLGFVAMVRKNLGHCRYFDSTRLNLPRMADGRHPDWTGGYRWASAVWKALGGTSEVPSGNPRPEP